MKKFRVWDKEKKEYINWLRPIYLDQNGNIYEGRKLHKNGTLVIEWHTGTSKIYEGDIVKIEHNDYPDMQFQINSSLCLSCMTEQGYDVETIKVIGNINENPELLEKP